MTLRLFALAGCGAIALVWWLAPAVTASPMNEADAPERDRASASRLVPVGITTAVRRDRYQRKRRYTGSFVAARASSLAFERAGKIVHLLVDEGASVTTGQPLAELDRRRVVAQRRATAAQLGEAEAVLDELVAGPRPEKIAAAEASVRRLAALRDSAEQNLERRRRLVDTRAISQEEYDDMLYSFQAAEAQLEQSREELNELVAGTRKEQIEAQRSRVEQLRAEVADLDHAVDDTTLRAPYAGVVARRLLDEGAIVSAGESVFRLIDQQSPELWVGLPTGVAAGLEPGRVLAAEVDGRVAEATVRSLRPELDSVTRTRNVVLLLEGVAPPVPGQIGRVTASEWVAESGFWAPTDALTPRGRGLWAVYVAEGAGPVRTVAARDVEVLYNDGDRSFVRGALTGGEALIATGAHRVVEGQRVAVPSDAESPRERPNE